MNKSNEQSVDVVEEVKKKMMKKKEILIQEILLQVSRLENEFLEKEKDDNYYEFLKNLKKSIQEFSLII
jgi:argonaute-like protein implicated in RNA metabolism and viral defense